LLSYYTFKVGIDVGYSGLKYKELVVVSSEFKGQVTKEVRELRGIKSRERGRVRVGY